MECGQTMEVHTCQTVGAVPVLVVLVSISKVYMNSEHVQIVRKYIKERKKKGTVDLANLYKRIVSLRNELLASLSRCATSKRFQPQCQVTDPGVWRAYANFYCKYHVFHDRYTF